MKHLLITDIHSNLEALEAILAGDFARGVDDVLCLGDIIGYGAEPHDTLERVRGLSRLTVMGNHDEAIVRPEMVNYFSRDAAVASKWTRETLSPEDRQWLGSLPYILREDWVTLVHADPYDPPGFEYILYASQARSRLTGPPEEVIFYGHTHWTAVFPAQGQSFKPVPGEPYILDPARGPHLINVGSSGQPRDGDNRACCAVLDTERREFTLHRVEYDYHSTARKILAAGLPRFLGDRLAFGK